MITALFFSLILSLLSRRVLIWSLGNSSLQLNLQFSYSRAAPAFCWAAFVPPCSSPHMLLNVDQKWPPWGGRLGFVLSACSLPRRGWARCEVDSCWPGAVPRPPASIWKALGSLHGGCLGGAGPGWWQAAGTSGALVLCWTVTIFPKSRLVFVLWACEVTIIVVDTLLEVYISSWNVHFSVEVAQ